MNWNGSWHGSPRVGLMTDGPLKTASVDRVEKSWGWHEMRKVELCARVNANVLQVLTSYRHSAGSFSVSGQGRTASISMCEVNSRHFTHWSDQSPLQKLFPPFLRQPCNICVTEYNHFITISQKNATNIFGAFPRLVEVNPTRLSEILIDRN